MRTDNIYIFHKKGIYYKSFFGKTGPELSEATSSLLLSGGSVGSTSCFGVRIPKACSLPAPVLGRGVPGPRALCSLLQRRCLSRVPQDPRVPLHLRFSAGDTLPPQTMRQILQTLGRLRKGQRAFYRDRTKYFYTPTHERFAFVTSYRCKNMVTVILA